MGRKSFLTNFTCQFILLLYHTSIMVFLTLSFQFDRFFLFPITVGDSTTKKKEIARIGLPAFLISTFQLIIKIVQNFSSIRN